MKKVLSGVKEGLKKVMKEKKTLVLAILLGVLVLLVSRNIIAALFLSLFAKRIFYWIRDIYNIAQLKRKFIHYEKKDYYVQYCKSCEKEVFTQRMGNIYLSGAFFVASLLVAKYYYLIPTMNAIFIGLGGFFFSMLIFSATRCTKCYEKTEKIKKTLNVATSNEEVGTVE
jgi:hypothetical protein